MGAKVLLSGYYGFDNFGDEAILKLLIQNLKSIDCDVHTLSNNPQKTALIYDIKSSYTFSLYNLINELRKCDVLLSGGGSLLQDSTSVKSLFYYLLVILIAKFFKKKVIIFAQGIGPITNQLAMFLTVPILKMCDYLSVRDEKSLFLLRGFGLFPELVNDPVWSLKIDTQIRTGAVGIQLRGWKSLTESFITKLAESVASNFKGRKIFIYSLQDSIDLAICRKFNAYLKLFEPTIESEIINNQSHEYMIKSVAKLEYLIAMRYHACLIGLKAGVKTLGIAYDEKVLKLATMAKIPCITLDQEDKLQYYIDMTKELEHTDIISWANTITYSFDKVNQNILNWTKKDK